jgi:predicted  nucleic acid-binding Zn-ribbon protein
LICSEAAVGLRKDDFVLGMHFIYERLAQKPIPDKVPEELVPPFRRAHSTKPIPIPHIIGNDLSSKATASGHPVGSLSSVAGTKLASFDEIVGATSNAAINPTTLSRGTISSQGAASLASTNLMGALPSYGPTLGSVSSGLPEAQELASLTSTTEALTLQRVSTTNQINSISVEKQNLMIRLGQVKATHDAEKDLLNGLQATLEQEMKAVEDLKNELLSLEKNRNEMQVEKVELQTQMQNHRKEAEAMRQSIMSLNFDINSMRQELNALREQAKREKENYEFNQQSVQNIEDTKGLIQSQLEDARKAKIQRDVSKASSPTKSISSAKSNDLPLHSVGSFELFGGLSGLNEPKDQTKSIESLRATEVNKSPGASSVKSFESTFPSPSKLGAVLNNSTNPAGSQPLDILNAGSQSNSPKATPVEKKEVFASAQTASTNSLANTSPTKVLTSATNTVAKSGSPIISNTSPSKAVDQSNISNAVNADVPDEYKKEFDDFSWDFPTVVSPSKKASNPTKAPTTNDFDPFGAPPAATAAKMNTSTAASNFDPFDGFSFASMAPSTNTTSPVVVSSSAPVSGGSNQSDPFSFDFTPGSLGSSPAPQIQSHAFEPFPLPGSSSKPASKAASPTALPSSSHAENIATLIALGVGKEKAENALERYDFDVQKASNFLVDEMAKGAL